MRPQDIFSLAFKGLKERRVRAILSILSVVVGVAAILALVSQTQGIQESVINSLQTLGPTSILLTPRTSALTQTDVAKILSVGGVEQVIPMVSDRWNVIQAGVTTSASVMGVSSEGMKTLIGEIRLVEGSIYPPTTAPLAVLGYNLAFPTSQGGQQVAYSGQPLILERRVGTTTRRTTVQVVGILEKYGSTPYLSTDDSVFLPLDAAMTLSNRKAFNLMLVKALDVDNVQVVTTSLTSIYGNSLQVQSIQQISQTVSQIIGQFSILLGTVAAISLSVASLGIMNIMLVSVYERMREIGILKSVGFRDRDILSMFLSEAVIIGFLGGFIGLLAGYGLSNILPVLVTNLFRPGGSGGQIGFVQLQSFSYTPVISPEIVTLALAVAIVVSIVAGMYPAWRASKMEPIKALKSE
ncbi:ABC transporter permease [Candidatus Bathyarchaeota archaeon]|nr:ABC transporter permease [Candidatus Bathyarchaeota archaeon]